MHLCVTPAPRPSGAARPAVCRPSRNLEQTKTEVLLSAPQIAAVTGGQHGAAAAEGASASAGRSSCRRRRPLLALPEDAARRKQASHATSGRVVCVRACVRVWGAGQVPCLLVVASFVLLVRSFLPVIARTPRRVLPGFEQCNIYGNATIPDEDMVPTGTERPIPMVARTHRAVLCPRRRAPTAPHRDSSLRRTACVPRAVGRHARPLCPTNQVCTTTTARGSSPSGQACAELAPQQCNATTTIAYILACASSTATARLASTA